MKRKTSVSLSEEVLRDLERYAGSGESRSAYIERVRAEINARDRERIDAAADRLNSEAAEILEHQASWLPD